MSIKVGGKRIFTVREASRLLRITSVTLYRWINGVSVPPKNISIRYITDPYTGCIYLSSQTIKRVKKAIKAIRPKANKHQSLRRGRRPRIKRRRK